MILMEANQRRNQGRTINWGKKRKDSGDNERNGVVESKGRSPHLQKKLRRIGRAGKEK